MKIVFSFLFSIGFALIYGQQFPVQAIPDSLKTNANVVTRLEEYNIEIKSPAKAIVHERHVYTVLNESGNYLSRYSSYYNKFVSINEISGVLYDGSGKEMKRQKKHDMEDLSGTGDESLMTDARYKICNLYNRTYPYTLDFEEEVEINGLLELNDWEPQGINNASVQLTRYVVTAPKDYVLRYKPVNCSLVPVITDKGDKKIYTWELKNLPAKKHEILSPPVLQIVPYVLIAPSDFEADGKKGNMNTWKSYGSFFSELLKDRNVLPEETKNTVHQLTDNLKTPREKIDRLYEYMQKNTRYISIQLGIGGFQPFDAAFVATKKYGDCKALSNFMVALLREAGIKGNSVIIKSGERNHFLWTDFPSDQFDHVISCVPLGKDTVWLECTSQTLPPGYLSSFTSDRYGLLVDESGGTLVHTPKYGLQDNLQVRKISAIVSETGDLTATVNTQYRAEQQDELEQYINGMSKERLMEYLKQEIELPTYDVVKFAYRQQRGDIPSIFEQLELTASNYAQISGKRLFVHPNVMTKSDSRLPVMEERKYDIELYESYREIDSVEITVPPGYQPESIPQGKAIETRFGKYFSKVEVSGDKITYYRLREHYQGRYPAKDYADLVGFYEQIFKSDRAKVVLIKKE